MPERISISFFDPAEDGSGIIFNQASADSVTAEDLPLLGEFEEKFLTWYRRHVEDAQVDFQIEGEWLLDAPHEEICKVVMMGLELAGYVDEDLRA